MHTGQNGSNILGYIYTCIILENLTCKLIHVYKVKPRKLGTLT